MYKYALYHEYINILFTTSDPFIPLATYADPLSYIGIAGETEFEGRSHGNGLPAKAKEGVP